MIRELDHLGVAVRSIDERLRFWREALGLEAERLEEVPSEKVRTAFLPVGDLHLELLEATSPDSPIERFLERRGEGIHHLCFRVENIDEAVRRLRAAGVPLVGEAPRPGAGGCRVAFLHPRGTGGVLVELSEPPEGS
jgi:methylmalonyl-CoA/ethylmalonyl-CoA epimerase